MHVCAQADLSYSYFLKNNTGTSAAPPPRVRGLCGAAAGQDVCQRFRCWLWNLELIVPDKLMDGWMGARNGKTGLTGLLCSTPVNIHPCALLCPLTGSFCPRRKSRRSWRQSDRKAPKWHRSGTM